MSIRKEVKAQLDAVRKQHGKVLQHNRRRRELEEQGASGQEAWCLAYREVVWPDVDDPDFKAYCTRGEKQLAAKSKDNAERRVRELEIEAQRRAPRDPAQWVRVPEKPDRDADYEFIFDNLYLSEYDFLGLRPTKGAWALWQSFHEQPQEFYKLYKSAIKPTLKDQPVSEEDDDGEALAMLNRMFGAEQREVDLQPG